MTDFFEERKNRQFDLMLQPAIEKLQKYTPQQICEKSGAVYNETENSIHIQSFSEDFAFTWPDFHICHEAEMWHHLTLLQYMDTADGTPLSDQWISLSQMRGGLSRGRGYEKHIQTMFLTDLKEITADEFRQACAALGAEFLPSRADVTAKIMYAPHFPVMINFWEADEEYPNSVKMLVNEMAEHYLGIEAAGGACLTVAEQIYLHSKVHC